jgi:hypothetical protein
MPSGKGNADSNLVWVVVILTVGAGLSAGCSAYICEFVLDSMQNSSAMVVLITDAGTVSDDKALERNLSSATMALQSCRDFGWALAVGCLGVGLAILVRTWRQRAA